MKVAAVALAATMFVTVFSQRSQAQQTDWHFFVNEYHGTLDWMRSMNSTKDKGYEDAKKYCREYQDAMYDQLKDWWDSHQIGQVALIEIIPNPNDCTVTGKLSPQNQSGYVKYLNELFGYDVVTAIEQRGGI